MLKTAMALAQLAGREGIRIADQDVREAHARGDLADMTGLKRFFAAYGLALAGETPSRKRFPTSASQTPCVAILLDGSPRIVLGPPEASSEGPRIPLVDPLQPGVLDRQDPEAFRKDWSGRILRFVGSASGERLDAISWSYVASWLTRPRMYAAALAGLSIVAILTNLAPIIYLQVVLDRVIGYEATSTLMVMTTGVLIALGVGTAASAYRDRLLSRSGADFETHVGEALSSRVARVGVPSPGADQQGEAAFNGLERTRRFAFEQVAKAGLDVLGAVVLVPVVFLYSTVLGAILLGFLVVAVVMNAWMGRRGKRLLQPVREVWEDRRRAVFETFSNAALNDATGLGESRRREIDRRMHKHAETRTLSDHNAAFASHATRLLQGTMTVALIFAGVQLVFAGQLSAGALIAVNLLATRTLQPVNRCGGLLAETGEAQRALDQINATLSWRERAAATGRRPTILGNYRLQGVLLEAGPNGVRTELNMAIEAGRWHCILGHDERIQQVGGLLDATRQPGEGSVLLDGTGIATINAAHLRRNIVRITSRPTFFAGTVADNLHRLYPDIDPAELDRSIAGLGLDDPLLPQGLDTEVTSDGAPLAQEAIARLAIARALLAGPTVIVLDCTVDSLPTRCARRILSDVRGRAPRQTIVHITGMPALVEGADRLTVMHPDGASVSGTPDEISVEDGAAAPTHASEGSLT